MSMKQKCCRGLQKEDGQAIVEAAIVIPLIILIICGIIDFGWIMSNQLMVNNCSREGARYAVVNSGESNLADLVTTHVQQVSGFGSLEDLSVTVNLTGTDDVQVQVKKTIKVLTPLVGIFVENQEIILQSNTVMRIG
ncbi:MAG: TadE/TadG family type IV pilus assembly protein [Clostridiaceae bacterium]|nr:TadE/TadG family type IV pilus assembly protein [Clostridiaceae bacterium]